MTEKWTEKRTYFKIRFPAHAGTYREWHRSNNGTNSWSSRAKVKAILSRGIQSGYKGRIRTPFTDCEVIQFTESVVITHEVIAL
ncbi:hypothetical protein [uncultured Paludibaculum sp.]|uniref:hypothetical protein n=1 Tax=uncultured Paludibaculum sp. TaxID=1765020 RepID=UPI002AAC0261|nr:hypothetical protein [uncultured Paludibaculum sp.]